MGCSHSSPAGAQILELQQQVTSLEASLRSQLSALKPQAHTERGSASGGREAEAGVGEAAADDLEPHRLRRGSHALDTMLRTLADSQDRSEWGRSLATEGLNISALSTDAKRVLINVMKDERPEVCVVGSINADFSLEGVSHVSKNRRFAIGSGSNIAQAYTLSSLGGKAGNAAFACAMCLAPSKSANGEEDLIGRSITSPITSYIGCIGKDEVGQTCPSACDLESRMREPLASPSMPSAIPSQVSRCRSSSDEDSARARCSDL